MQYIAAVSGGQDSSIQQVKEMVLATNPLLESFGCAKTLRNNNSSRHGKYLELLFNAQGEPIGAQITNYLLEKGRVVGQIENERDFHIFYQFTKGAADDLKESFGLQGPEAYAITSRSNCLEVPGIDDVQDWHDTLKAMQVIGLSPQEQNDIFRMLAIILWLGNLIFEESDDGYSKVDDPGVTEFIAYLMETDAALVEKALTIRVMETQRGGRRGSVYDVPLNPIQAIAGRDALAKAIYNNLFEWIVSRVNISMKPRSAHAHLIGVLDIYGFEIFQDNSFEQLCINYVNEKLQQIFIELTLKAEQEEYVREQIKWTPIKYFNNKIVCDLIEERRPPGIFAALNDACATAHADPAAADNAFVQRLAGLSSNAHFDSRGAQFLVKHYAGDVMYNVAGMTDKNKDTLIKDLLDIVSGSGNAFLRGLFPDRPDPNSKKRPPTAGDKIKASAGALVDNLMKARPSYIRTIKPNENRSPSEYDTKAIIHQIKYLGLQENIRVRRAGFAYRNTFEKMVERNYWRYKNECAARIQRFWKNNKEGIAYAQIRDYGHQMLAGRKERRRFSLLSYRRFMGDYLDVGGKNALGEMIRNACGITKGETVHFSMRIQLLVSKLGRSSKPSPRYLVATEKAVHMVITTVHNGATQMAVERKIPLVTIKSVAMSSLRDDWVVLNLTGISEEGDPVFSCYFKTELSACLMQLTRAQISLIIAPQIEYAKKKEKKATITFQRDETVQKDDVYKSHMVRVASGEPANSVSRPPAKRKQREARPITKGKLLRAGGPTGPKPAAVSKSKPKPQAQPLPNQTTPAAAVRPPAFTSTPAAKPAPVATPAAAALKAASKAPASNRLSMAPPAPPPPPPPPPPVEEDEPEQDRYRAIYAFGGQEGEMSLEKGDVVELIEKDANGWWLVKKGSEEGWTPSNYLELIPPKPKPAKAPAPPPATRRAPPPAPGPSASAAVAAPKPKPVVPQSVTADASAKPIAVFPGIGAANGGAAPWRRSVAGDSTPEAADSRPSSSLANKPPAPAPGVKPKPPIGSKPAPPKVPGKPSVPVAKVGGGAPAAPPRPAVGGGPKAPGQMDLAAALAKRAQRMEE
ncbi:class II myosin [Tulasnella sp. 427]|nr:class II myosin [Tulasnella sp. 427]